MSKLFGSATSKKLQAMLGLLGSLLFAGVAAAQGQWSAELDVPGVNGRVFGLGSYNGEVIAGGYEKFATDGAVLDHVAAFDGNTWHGVGGGVNGLVRATTVFNGELIVAGQFGLAGGRLAASVARWDGTQWHPLGQGIELSWNPQGAEVWDVAVYRGELYAGGEFDTAGGQSISLIARWDGTSWKPVGQGLTSTRTYPKVLSLLVTSDDRLVVAGEFDRAAGQSARNIAVWDGSTWSRLGSGLGSEFSSVFSLEEYQGNVYAGGNFRSAGGQPAEKIARWDGAQWHPLRGGVPDWAISVAVYALEVFQDELYVGGNFIAVDGSLPASRVAKWNGQQWIGFGGVAGMDLKTTVFDMQVVGEHLYIGGEFTRGGIDLSPGNAVVSNDVIAFDGSQFLQVGRGLGGAVGKLLHWNGGIVSVGHAQEAGRAYSPELAFFDGNDWSSLGTFNFGGHVNDAVVWKGDLVIIGTFQTIDGQDIAHTARYDGTTWTTFGQWGGGEVIEVYRDQLYVGGSTVVRWNGTKWETFTDQIAGQVHAMEVFQDKLYIGGYLNLYVGPGPHLVVYDGQTVQGVGGGTSDYVESLFVYNDELLVGGRFDTVGGSIDAPLLARWTGSQWLAWPGLKFTGFSVRSFATFQGDLYVGGDLYYGYSGRTDDYLAQWDGSAWVAVGGGVHGYVMHLLADEAKGHLWASGGILTAGGLPSHYMARWEVETPCAASWELYGQGWPGTNGVVPSISLSANPILGTTVQLLVGNSRQQTTPATVLIGLQKASDLTRWDGTLLLQPLITIGLTAPASQLAVPFTLPNDDALCGQNLFLQTVLIDPGASRGLSFTPGLSATLGR